MDAAAVAPRRLSGDMKTEPRRHQELTPPNEGGMTEMLQDQSSPLGGGSGGEMTVAPDEVAAVVRLHKLVEGRRELSGGVRRLGLLHRGRHLSRLFRQVTVAEVHRDPGLTASGRLSGEKPPLSPHPLPARYRYRRLQVEGTRP